MASELPSWTPAAVTDRLLEAAGTQIGIGMRSKPTPDPRDPARRTNHHLAGMAGSDGRRIGVGAGQADALEGHLLEVGTEPTDSASQMAALLEIDRRATQWPTET